MKAVQLSGACLLGLLGGLAGCSKYTITFEVENVINTGGGPETEAEQLDVDIVCLSKGDADGKFRSLVENRVLTDQWFKERDERRGDFSELGSRRIFALRSGSKDSFDTRLDAPLVPGKFAAQKERVVTILHLAGLDANSAIVVFGRFKDAKGGLRKTPPVIVRPLPSM